MTGVFTTKGGYSAEAIGGDFVDVFPFLKFVIRCGGEAGTRGGGFSGGEAGTGSGGVTEGGAGRSIVGG